MGEIIAYTAYLCWFNVDYTVINYTLKSPVNSVIAEMKSLRKLSKPFSKKTSFLIIFLWVDFIQTLQVYFFVFDWNVAILIRS